MTAKHVPVSSEPPPLPKLTMSRADAEKQIVTRIDSGKALLDVNMNSAEEYETIKRQYKKWHDYNIELLRRIFDSVEESRNYVGALLSFGTRIYLKDKIIDLREDIQKYINRLESIKERLLLFPEPTQTSTNAPIIFSGQSSFATKEVFIVHGTAHGLKDTVARFLTKLNLEPKILHEQPNLGDTIIEKLEYNSLVAFAIVLLTPDDKGGPNSDSASITLRARQNVVFELGYFIGKLGRNKVCALYSEGVELPSDFQGIVYILIDNHGAWRFQLAKELRAAGLNIDLNNLS